MTPWALYGVSAPPVISAALKREGTKTIREEEGKRELNAERKIHRGSRGGRKRGSKNLIHASQGAPERKKGRRKEGGVGVGGGDAGGGGGRERTNGRSNGRILEGRRGTFANLGERGKKGKGGGPKDNQKDPLKTRNLLSYDKE